MHQYASRDLVPEPPFIWKSKILETETITERKATIEVMDKV